MSRIIIITNAFAPFRVFKASMNQVYSTMGLPNVEHYVLNQHYPLDKEENTRLIKEYCDYNKMIWLDAGHNLGLAGGLNHMLAEAKPTDEDIVIGLDPDVWPITQNWGEPLVKVAQHPQIAWSSLYNSASHHEFEERPFTQQKIQGYICRTPHQPMLNSICAWKGAFLNKLQGGLKEGNHYYGGLEVMSYKRVKELGYLWTFIRDYQEQFDESVRADDCYRIYKYEYAIKHSTKLDFESWLTEDFTRKDLK